MKRRSALASALALLAAQRLHAATPPRVVTVGGGITEIVYLLGGEAQLVGTDTTSQFPDAANRTPKVGYQRQLSAEGLLSLKPDAIVATDEAGPAVVIEQVRTAGVKLELVPVDHSWEEIRRKVQAVGRALDKPREAAALLERLDDEWKKTQDAVRTVRPAKPPRVLFVLAHAQSPQAAGTGTAAHAVIEFAGGANAMQSFANYRPLTAEAVVAVAPDVVLTSRQGIEAAGGADVFWRLPGLALTPAGKRRALIAPDILYLLGFGPRLPQAVTELAAQLAAAVA